MSIKVTFASTDQLIDTTFEQSGMEFTADFGQLQILHDGQNGATYTPSVSADGTLTWSNDRDLPNPEPVNIMGPQGPKGDAGATGPKGDKGDTGPQGERGTQGPKGDAGATGPQGAQGPKGDTGPEGPQGPKGDTGPAYTLTTADKAEMVSAVIDALPVYNGEVVSV